MKIILLQDVVNLGIKYDVKDVADGYARNFLFPKSLAKLATKSDLSNIEKMREMERGKQRKELAEIQNVAKKLEGQKIEIAMKISEDGTFYGSITSANIVSALKKKGFDVKKEQIVLKKPIKEAGVYDVTIKFSNEMEIKIRVAATEEKAKK
ncbi:MAG: 50S ribosomal protein L9 [Parcubacteria group bacterium GW2011_GWA2_38_13b]|nr:MAG: 50S ribosomal protein L9 [Parcubacteria group bacterium GW2011_GWA2_38_13b]